MASRPFAAAAAPDNDRRTLDHAIDAFRGEVANAGSHMTIDGRTRRLYDQLIAQLSRELRDEAAAGRISWREAATRANEIRNEVMQRLRGRSTPVGRALAEWLKREGRTLNGLVAHYTRKLYGDRADFTRLRAVEQQAVYREVVDAAGRSSRTWTPRMARVSIAGRGLLIVSLSVAIYNIATAEDHAAAARREGALLGGGVAGGMAGGAIAGLMCGPGAPVCVTVGAFVGGAAAAFGVSRFL